MPLEFTLRSRLDVPLDVADILLSACRSLSAEDCARLPVVHGNHDAQVGDFFTVSGSAAEDNIAVWSGDLSKLRRLGEGHDGGTLRVEGSVGLHVGARMKGGVIEVTGDADDWAGAEMRGGRLIVRGSVGRSAGGAYRGATSGMRGGEILIHGNAGDELGSCLRRGLIAVAGKTGAAAGSKMLAGTLVLAGPVGPGLGLANRRGTMLVLNDRPPLLPTYRYAARYRPVITRAMLRHLRSLGFPLKGVAPAPVFERYCGDLLEGGRGEILLATA